MIIPLLLAFQIAEPPVLPAGTTQHMTASFIQVEEELSKGNFDAAKKLAAELPSLKFSMAIDLTNVPADKKASFKESVQEAVLSYKNIIKDLDVTFIEKGTPNIWIRFANNLELNENGLPKGGVFMTSHQPGDSQVEATISLVRGKPNMPTLPSEVHNETLFAISQYFGIEKTIRGSAGNFRSDLPGVGKFLPTQIEVLQAVRIVQAADLLRKAANEKIKVDVARPQLTLEASKFNLEPAVQGEERVFSIQITNNGNSTLTLKSEVDCSCLNPAHPLYLLPGKSDVIRVGINTYDFVGKVHKVLRLLSNDPEFPLREIAVNIDIKPMVRFITPIRNLLMDETGATGEAYLLLDNDADFKPEQVFLDGVKGTATYEPWEGEIADPEIGDEVRKRKGYKFTVKFQPTTMFGRVPTTLRISTDSQNPRYKILRANFEIQKGIVSMPEQVFFGEIKLVTTTAHSFISRPGKPFKILKITSSNPFVSGEARPTKNDTEYRLDVRFDGKGDYGKLEGFLTLETDDPSQPKVIVPFRGTIL